MEQKLFQVSLNLTECPHRQVTEEVELQSSVCPDKAMNELICKTIFLFDEGICDLNSLLRDAQ